MVLSYAQLVSHPGGVTWPASGAGFPGPQKASFICNVSWAKNIVIARFASTITYYWRFMCTYYPIRVVRYNPLVGPLSALTVISTVICTVIVC